MDSTQYSEPHVRVGFKCREYFESGLLCAESVLLSVTESLGIRNELIPRIATGFCAGISRTSGLCGALTGGILALNVVFGRDKPSDSRTKNYALTAHFLREFEKLFGSTSCMGLLGCDISTEEGSKEFFKKDLMNSVCAIVTEKAADLVLEVIRDQENIRHPLDLG